MLAQLFATLRPRGVLFSSNPRGGNEEGWSGSRYGCYHDHASWHEQGIAAGFELIRHYYRPAGLPREQQPWLATVWRRPQEARPRAAPSRGQPPSRGSTTA